MEGGVRGGMKAFEARGRVPRRTNLDSFGRAQKEKAGNRRLKHPACRADSGRSWGCNNERFPRGSTR